MFFSRTFFYVRYVFFDILTAFAAALPVLGAFHAVCIKKDLEQGQRPRTAHLIAVYLFCLSLMAVLCITGVPNIFSLRLGRSSVNLVPFDVFFTNTVQYLQNVLLFVPVGLFLPLAWRTFQKASRTVASGLLLSLAVETLQLFSYRATDVDDLMMNTLGAALGYLIFAAARRMFPRILELSDIGGGLWKYEPAICVAAPWAVTLLFSAAISRLG